MKFRLPRTFGGQSAAGAASCRSVASSSRETIALVLEEDTLFPESDQDVRDLALRLRGHLMQLAHLAGTAPAVTIGNALKVARELADTEVPGEYVTARVYLRDLAVGVQSVIAEMAHVGLVCGHWPECPPAGADSPEGERVRAQCIGDPEPPWSLLNSGAAQRRWRSIGSLFSRSRAGRGRRGGQMNLLHDGFPQVAARATNVPWGDPEPSNLSAKARRLFFGLREQLTSMAYAVCPLPGIGRGRPDAWHRPSVSAPPPALAVRPPRRSAR